MKHLKSQSGFTLIEIIVVVAIIGILASVAVISFNEPRQMARDSTRASSLKQLQIAIEAYKDKYGLYPDAGCGSAGKNAVPVSPGPTTNYTDDCEEYIQGLVPEFIAALPKDPNQEYELDKGMIYVVDITRTMYKAGFYDTVERNFITSYDQEFAMCPYQVTLAMNPNSLCIDLDNITTTYAVYSAGAEIW